MARDKELEELMSRNLVPASQFQTAQPRRGRSIPLLPPETAPRSIPQMPYAPPAGFEPQPGPIQQLGQKIGQTFRAVGERPVGETIGAVGRQIAAPVTTTATGLQLAGQKVAEGLGGFGEQVARGALGPQVTAAAAPATEPVAAPTPEPEVRPANNEMVTIRPDATPQRDFENIDATMAGPVGAVGTYRGPTSTAGMSDEERTQFEAQRQADIRANVARLNQATEAQRELNAVRKAQAYMNLPESQRGRMPDDVARVLGRETEPAGGTGGGIGQPSFQEAMADYASGRVGTPGYNMIRNLRVGSDGFLSGARARNRAMSLPPRQRARALAALARGGQEGAGIPGVAGREQAAGPSVRDQLDIARFQREGAETQAENIQRAQQQAFENQLATLREQREQTEAEQRMSEAEQERRSAFREEMDQSLTMPTNPIARQFVSDTAWSLAQESGGDPREIAEMLRQDLGEVPESGELDPEQLRAARDRVAAMIREQIARSQ